MPQNQQDDVFVIAVDIDIGEALILAQRSDHGGNDSAFIEAAHRAMATSGQTL
ncbi:MAG: hypothetical protein M3O22_04255 [Pseudomonadota bacterium]|nr:hypothetical protein [Pseudomonadota bacterium]